MLYPVYIHMGDAKHAHGVTVPDFPGCFSAADNWDQLPANIQEAIKVYCEGEDMARGFDTRLGGLFKRLAHRCLVPSFQRPHSGQCDRLARDALPIHRHVEKTGALGSETWRRVARNARSENSEPRMNAHPHIVDALGILGSTRLAARAAKRVLGAVPAGAA